jgi:hypothetical protein
MARLLVEPEASTTARKSIPASNTGIRNHSPWASEGVEEKITVVTDIEWIGAAISLFRFAGPCPVKVFAIRDLAEAIEWMRRSRAGVPGTCFVVH